MGWRTPLILAVGAAVFLAYAGLLTWILASRDLPGLGVMSVLLVAMAIPVEFAGKWLFGAQFQDGITRMGRHLGNRSAFRAALIGAGVARLIPAGGAVTPVAMAWSVRSEVRGTTGAAVRATMLNYAGLLIGTGGFLLWIAYRAGILPEAIGAAAGVGAIALVAGGILMFGSSRLGTLVRMLPASLRRRLDPAFENHAADGRAQLLLWSRLACEAAVLGIVALAFGIRVTPVQVLAAFGISQLVGGLPGPPGGLGFAEAGLVGALVAFGVPTDESIATALVYRIVSYWTPVAAGLVAGGMAFLRARDISGIEAENGAA